MIGKNIRQIRKSKNMSINKLSKISGVSLGFLSDIENGKTNPSLDTLEKIAIGLQVEMKDFFEHNSSQINKEDSKEQQKKALLFLEGANENTLWFFKELEKMGMFNKDMTKEELEYLTNLIEVAMKKPD